MRCASSAAVTAPSITKRGSLERRLARPREVVTRGEAGGEAQRAGNRDASPPSSRHPARRTDTPARRCAGPSTIRARLGTTRARRAARRPTPAPAAHGTRCARQSRSLHRPAGAPAPRSSARDAAPPPPACRARRPLRASPRSAVREAGDRIRAERAHHRVEPEQSLPPDRLGADEDRRGNPVAPQDRPRELEYAAIAVVERDQDRPIGKRAAVAARRKTSRDRSDDSFRRSRGTARQRCRRRRAGCASGAVRRSTDGRMP